MADKNAKSGWTDREIVSFHAMYDTLQLLIPHSSSAC